MKRKLLFDIPNHAAPTSKLPVFYIITSTIAVVNEQRVLFMCFWSQKKRKALPDFKVYIWDRKYISLKLQENGSYKGSEAIIGNLINRYWSYEREKLYAGCSTRAEREMISDFLNIVCIRSGDEFDAICKYQENILEERRNARHNRIMARIDAVMNKVGSLPKNFEVWVDNTAFAFSRYIYYKRNHKDISAFCTHCKKNLKIPETAATKKKIKHNGKGICPNCHKKVTYKAVGKTKNQRDWTNFAIIQRFENGLIVRYFNGSKSYLEHYKRPELQYSEKKREIYSYTGNSLECKCYEYTSFLSTNILRWCNDTGYYGTPSVCLYTSNLREILKNTKWQYSCLYDFAKKVDHFYVDDFLSDYIKQPGIEYLIKFRLFNLVNSLLGHHYWEDINFKGKGLKEIFSLDKSSFLQLKRLNLGVHGLRILVDAEKINKALSDQQVKWLISQDLHHDNFLEMMNHTTAHKIIKYATSQERDNYSIGGILNDWLDYLRQCKALELDIKNSFVLFPKDLRAKHEEYSALLKAKKLEAYNSKISEAYFSLYESLTFSNKKFIIRPAASADEIVQEGNKQHHCVGGDWYIRKMAEGEGAILFIRKAEDPDTPFYTMEISLKNYSIVQCRGFRNCDMTTEVKSFINTWKQKKLSKKVIENRIQITLPA
jgi:hypothetical protein